MGMMNAGMTEAASRTPMAGMDDQDGDQDQMVTCPNCHTQFAPGDTDGDAAALAAGAGAGAPTGAAGQGDLGSVAPPAVVSPGGGTCPECGGKMEGGTCSSCGYSKSHSPMRDAATKYANLQPDHGRPDVDKVVEQGRRVRERMRRPAPFGRA